MEGLRGRIKKRVSEELDLSNSISNQEILRILDSCIMQETKETYISLKERMEIRRDIFNQIRGLDVLSEILEEDEITEIMVNGYNNIFVEKNGVIERVDKSFENEKRLDSVVQQIVSSCNRRVNEGTPIVDARLEDGSRVNVVMRPVSLGGTIVTIRKFPNKIMDMNNLIRMHAIDEEAAEFLKYLVKARYNIFVSGGTGTGKTTFLNALSEYIPKDERVITIEDSAELRLQGIDNLVRLEARNANVEGENQVRIRDLIKASLRMRPDRIIVGEVRGEEAVDMLQAMNTGHDGSISTGHANSCEDMLKRLETMVLMGLDMPLLAIKQQIASAVDIVIHLGRLRDKTRRVLKICEVLDVKEGEIELNTLYEFVELGEQYGKIYGKLHKVNDIMNLQKLTKNCGLYVFREEEEHEQITAG